MMRVEQVLLEGLAVGERHRRADPAKVAILAESMKHHGQLQPVSVYEAAEGACQLVAGLHRVEAARALGWDMISAVFIEGDSIKREMVEIAENLHRCDLTKDERDRQIRRYAELLEAELVSTQNATKLEKRPEGRPKGTIARVAEQTGLSKDTVRRAINPPAPKPSAPSAPEPTDPADDEFDALMAAWSRAGDVARQRFLAAVSAPSPTPPTPKNNLPTSPPIVPPKTKASRRKPGIPLPSTWVPRRQDWEAAGLDAAGGEFCAAKMRNWAAGKDARKVDWDATYRNFCLTESQSGRVPRSAGSAAPLALMDPQRLGELAEIARQNRIREGLE